MDLEIIYLFTLFSISNMIILGMLYKAKCDDILGLLAEYELVLYFRKRTAKYNYSFSRWWPVFYFRNPTFNIRNGKYQPGVHQDMKKY